MRAIRRPLLALVLLSACSERPPEQLPEVVLHTPASYSSERIEGHVIDAATAAPVSGAVVVAVWRNISTIHGSWKNIYRFQEVATDVEGRFAIDAWGPGSPPQNAYLDRRDPEIWILKRGYRLGYFDNDGQQRPLAPAPGSDEAPVFIKLPPNKLPKSSIKDNARGESATSIWNGKKLPLARAASDEENARSLLAAKLRDPLLPQHLKTQLFDGEWQAARRELPDEWQAKVVEPMSLLDYTVPWPGPGIDAKRRQQ